MSLKSEWLNEGLQVSLTHWAPPTTSLVLSVPLQAALPRRTSQVPTVLAIALAIWVFHSVLSPKKGEYLNSEKGGQTLLKPV